jgi:hypothetical protein
MIELVLFVVFFALWVVTTLPSPAFDPYRSAGAWFGLICVGLLGFVVFHGRL